MFISSASFVSESRFSLWYLSDTLTSLHRYIKWITVPILLIFSVGGGGVCLFQIVWSSRTYQNFGQIDHDVHNHVYYRRHMQTTNINVHSLNLKLLCINLYFIYKILSFCQTKKRRKEGIQTVCDKITGGTVCDIITWTMSNMLLYLIKESKLSYFSRGVQLLLTFSRKTAL